MMDPVFSLSLHEHFVSEHKDDVSFPNERPISLPSWTRSSTTIYQLLII